MTCWSTYNNKTFRCNFCCPMNTGHILIPLHMNSHSGTNVNARSRTVHNKEKSPHRNNDSALIADCGRATQKSVWFFCFKNTELTNTLTYSPTPTPIILRINVNDTIVHCLKQVDLNLPNMRQLPQKFSTATISIQLCMQSLHTTLKLCEVTWNETLIMVPNASVYVQ